jgi:glucokinase
MKYNLLADLGGTKLSTVIVDSEGICLTEIRKWQTNSDYSKTQLVENIIDNLKLTLEYSNLRRDQLNAIMMGVPTRLDKNGFLNPCPNLPTLGNFDLKGALKDALNVDVFLAPDAICFIAGEFVLRGGNAQTCICGLTLGTGVGLSMFINGKPFYGSNGFAGENWISAYRDGMWEDYISSSSIRNDFFKNTGQNITVLDIAEKAKAGDTIAIQVIKNFAEHLGYGLSFIINTLDPECVVIGGSISKSWDLIEPYTIKIIESHLVEGAKVSIETSLDPDLSPLKGVEYLAKL